MRAILFACALFAAPAAAVTIDPGTPGPATAETNIDVDGTVTTYYGLGSYTVGGATVTITASPVAAVGGSATTLAGSTTGVGFLSVLNYEYLVKVAAIGDAQRTILDLVTIKGVSNFSSSGLARGYVEAVSSGHYDGSTKQYYQEIGLDGGSFSEAFTLGGAADYVGLTNENGASLFVYRGTLGLVAAARAYEGVGGNVAVKIDPLITVNSNALQGAGLSGPATVQLSPGVSNALSVPEPASWALMIGGFGMIGAALRRRRSAFA